MTASTSSELSMKLENFVQERDYPCVGAKSAAGRGGLVVISCRDMREGVCDRRILDGVEEFVQSYRKEQPRFSSLVAVFAGPEFHRESEFETALWDRLQALHELDEKRHPWDPRVSADPESHRFSFSLAGEGFFVIGLHPRSSRRSRRFSHPAMVFNLHDQFERLRADDTYATLSESIRRRDEKFCSAPNPMLSEFGKTSEARQYSGRAVAADWRCPFKRVKTH